MHVPDGFINIPVSVVAGGVAAVGLAVSLRGARRELDERTAPLAGLVAAFVFAAQMINFPVAGGTSGHLLGGVLAAVLVGPCTGVLCICVVLGVQGLMFADGGLTALGVNITNMALVGVGLGYLCFRLLVSALPKTRGSVVIASGIAAFLSVPLAAAAFTAFYALGATSSIPIGTVFTAMVGVHLLIGVGEALITMATVQAVLSTRPDLVHGARHLDRSASLKGYQPSGRSEGESVA